MVLNAVLDAAKCEVKSISMHRDGINLTFMIH